MAPIPQRIEIIGPEVAILWSDGAEHYFPAPFLRARSPSAEVSGEQDIFGVTHGGEHVADGAHAAVTVTGWDRIGGYAIRFLFSDGHRTGLYTYGYLRQLAHALGQSVP